MSRIWSEAAAILWEDAYPLGNGRLGAMVYGEPQKERLSLNEETMWYGSYQDRNNPDAKEALPRVRELLLNGQIGEAERLLRFAFSGTPESMHPYQPMGELRIEMEKPGVASRNGKEIGNAQNSDDVKGKVKKEEEQIGNYYRELDLEEAICRVVYDRKESVSGQKGEEAITSYEREYFISAPDNLLVIRLKAKGQKKLRFFAGLRRERFFTGTKRGKIEIPSSLSTAEKSGTQSIARFQSHDVISLWGQLGDGGLHYEMQLSGYVTDGSIYALGDSLIVEEAGEAVLLLSGMTNYSFLENSDCRTHTQIQKKLSETLNGRIAAGFTKGYEKLKEDHIADYRSYFHRVKLQLEPDETIEPSNNRLYENELGKKQIAYTTNKEERTTPELLAETRNRKPSPKLIETYFDFGRYLLISCSRPGTLPATLQGLWNGQMLPPWDSKYTININTQMNYWPAETCNLSECHTALLDHIARMVENGRKTAQVMYGCRGFVAHHNTDIWGDTAVQDLWIPGSYWVMGAAWLCTHQWTHYCYTLDHSFLEKAFPIMREAALFFVDFLIEKDGYLVTCPSVSPENTFLLPNGEYGCNGSGVTMDNQILRDLFTQCIEAAKILDIDDELNQTLMELRQRLRPTQIASNGTILEWEKEYEEAEPGHRHISHLYGLYPSEQITPEKTPELAQAARKTIERRLSLGGGHTGWSCAWLINLYARLGDGENAYRMLNKILANSTLPNLFDNHPPFQIDGNFGATAAIVEMLIQARQKKVYLLPALPEEWKTGSIEGICLPGKAIASLQWKDGRVVVFTVKAEADWSAEIVYGSMAKTVSVRAGEMQRVF